MLKRNYSLNEIRESFHVVLTNRFTTKRQFLENNAVNYPRSFFKVHGDQEILRGMGLRKLGGLHIISIILSIY